MREKTDKEKMNPFRWPDTPQPAYPNVQWPKDGFEGYKCCEKCNNNPKNNPFATGFCACTLPYMERPIMC